MIRFYLGLRTVPQAIGPRELAAAKAVLREKMNFVLVTERLGEAGCLLGKIGWDGEVPVSGARYPSLTEVFWEEVTLEKERERREPAAAALLDRITAFDEELYAYAVELFEEQLALCECCERREVGAGEHWGA